MRIVASRRATSRSVGGAGWNRVVPSASRAKTPLSSSVWKWTVQLEAPAKPLDRGDRATAAVTNAAVTPAPALEAEECTRVNGEHGATENVIPGEAVAERVRQGEHPLADGDVGQDVVDELRAAGRHPPAAAARTETPSLAGERHERFRVAPGALKPREAAAPDATIEKGAKLLLEETREPARIGARRGGEEAFEVLPDDLVEPAAGRVARRVPQGRNGCAALDARGGFVSDETTPCQRARGWASLRVDGGSASTCRASGPREAGASGPACGDPRTPAPS